MATMSRIRVLSLAKLQAAVMTFVGLIAGIAYSIGGAILDALSGSLSSGTALAFLALIGMPLLSAILGFVTGAIEAYLYNVASRWFGGVEIYVER
jgi:hypothetical protein